MEAPFEMDLSNSVNSDQIVFTFSPVPTVYNFACHSFKAAVTVGKFTLTTRPTVDCSHAKRTLLFRYMLYDVLAAGCFELFTGEGISCMVTKRFAFKNNLFKVSLNS